MPVDPLNLFDAFCDTARLSSVPANHWPEIRSAQSDGALAKVVLHIQHDLYWLEGHFPGQPVLPGVVQTHWASLWASTIFDIQTHFQSLTRLKFKAPVLPGQVLSLNLNYIPDSQQVNFSYVHGSENCSSGTLGFGAIKK